MKKIILFLSLVTSFAVAKEAKTVTPVIEVSDAKIFAPLKGTNATAGYGLVKNLTDKEVVLKISKAEPFKAVEAHETKEKSGKMTMEKVESFKISPQGSLELKQGGHHIMLFDASRELKVGEELTVQFSVNGKNVNTKFKVESRVEAADPHAGHH